MFKDWGNRAAARWARFWMRFASLKRFGRVATSIATWVPLPFVEYYIQQRLAHLYEFGYVAGSASIHHNSLRLGRHIFINGNVCIFRDQDGGPVSLGERVWIGEGCGLGTGQHGSIEVGEYTSIGPGSSLVAYLSAIRIGAHTMIGPNCHFYPYNHGMATGVMMQAQSLVTKGDIVVEDDVWVGRGATILSGVSIRKGSVVGAGAVVTRDVQAGTIVAGNPARVVGRRDRHEASVMSDRPLEAIIVRSFDGFIKYWNRDASSLYGWQREEAVAKQTHSLLNTQFPQTLELIEEELTLTGHWEGSLVHVSREGVQMIVRSRWELYENEMEEVDVLEINRLDSPRATVGW